MRESESVIAGLHTTIVAPEGPPAFAAVLLHGYAMDRSDLAPFAHSLGLQGVFYFPRGPIRIPNLGYAWWPVNAQKRETDLKAGPRELASESPPGRPETRMLLRELVSEVRSRNRHCPIIVGGFSQGGMMACDAVLLADLRAEALVLLSSCRINFEAWASQSDRVINLPVFLSHGRGDQNISYGAAKALRDWLIASGAEVTWVPFDGDHSVPLHVWRHLRKFMHKAGQYAQL
jgi:phospholipase/carboxylesterase